MLRNLTAERAKIGDAMVWCLEHADAADEVSLSRSSITTVGRFNGIG